MQLCILACCTNKKTRYSLLSNLKLKVCFFYYSDFSNFHSILNLWTLLHLSISLYINWEVTVSTKAWIVKSAETQRQNLPFRSSKHIKQVSFFFSRIPRVLSDRIPAVFQVHFGKGGNTKLKSLFCLKAAAFWALH